MLSNKKRKILTITSEKQAFAVLEQALNGSLPEFDELEFKGWPNFELYLKGKKFDQSITATVMKGLLELQNGFYRAYSIANYDHAKKRLTQAEKDELELTIKVNNGSSLFETNVSEVATNIAKDLVGKMSGTELVVVLVTALVSFFGTSAYKHFLDARKEERLKNSSDAAQIKMLETMQFSSAEETNRSKIIADAMKHNSQALQIVGEAHLVQAELLKAAAAGDSSKFGGVTLTNEMADALTQGSRRESKQVRLDGEYRLLKLDWSTPSSVKVKIQNVKTFTDLNAVVQDDSLTGEHKEAIKTAEWQRKNLTLEINAKLIGDSNYSEVTIVSAKIASN